MRVRNFGILAVLFLLPNACHRTRPELSLRFPEHAYTIDTLVVQTGTGRHTVLVKATMHVPYVKNIVDIAYQSFNIFEPIAIDSLAIDAREAPILFAIGVGAYKAVNNAESLPLSRRKGPAKNEKIEQALAAGFVVVEPGCRGRENQLPNGLYYGKAPAAVVDLKAALRYLRYNEGHIPGNVDKIIALGCSAGAALAALLGVSGNSELFESYLKNLGVPNEDDHVFACACYSPIIDLEHADMAYEWMFGTVPTKYGLVNQKLSKYLKEQFAEYQRSLQLSPADSFGILTADRYGEYLLQQYLYPSAASFIQRLSDEQRIEYLREHPWLHWDSSSVSFTFTDFVNSIGRLKGLPAFDDFRLRSPANSLFGNEKINARHFTVFSQRIATNGKDTTIDDEVHMLVKLMNPHTFLLDKPAECAHYWWLRNGTLDTHTSFTIMVNFALLLQQRGCTVSTWFYWDAGHCGDHGTDDLLQWMQGITGYTLHRTQ
ncbi:MAG: Tat pathway signal protein [Bacteroidetes bacterium]|nr:Tat pathway signal protein [Bacteroidota bacterium]